MVKYNINESKLKHIISESVKEVLSENFSELPFGGVPGILRLNPSDLSDDELKTCLKILSVNADEYNFSKEDQIKFDSFWDEHKRRQ
jgi:hypothetical protein